MNKNSCCTQLSKNVFLHELLIVRIPEFDADACSEGKTMALEDQSPGVESPGKVWLSPDFPTQPNSVLFLSPSISVLLGF